MAGTVSPMAPPSSDRLERFRTAIANAGFEDVAKRCRADDDGDPLVPWVDEVPPQSREEVDAVRRAYNIVYGMRIHLGPDWTTEMFIAWAEIPDAWWLVAFESDLPGRPPDLLGGIVVDTPFRPLALSRAIENGIKPRGTVKIMGPFIWRDTEAPCPLNVFMMPPELISYGLHETQ